LRISPVAHHDLRFRTPSGKVEFYSERSLKWGLPPLPEYREPVETPRSRPEMARRFPLVLRPGRTFGHFNNFYRNGRAIRRLALRESEPVVWLHPGDAAARGIQERQRVMVFNDRSEFQGRAKVSVRMFPGVVWVRTGWPGLNALTACAPCLPDAAVEVLGFPAGQAAHEALVEVKKLL
ncbi:MAG: molybdopterin oxidoreductase family protein, partial [Deltaproteobacteria bacterium]|nr:molybdopterin oxidoreductase family protein [Deltaproteobacteria bacterium]